MSKQNMSKKNMAKKNMAKQNMAKKNMAKKNMAKKTCFIYYWQYSLLFLTVVASNVYFHLAKDYICPTKQNICNFHLTSNFWSILNPLLW